MKDRPSLSRSLFMSGNFLLLTLLSLSMLLPFLNVIAKSFSTAQAVSSGKVAFAPIDFTWINYAYVFQDVSIWRSFAVSVYITFFGTIINLAFTALLAYPISRPEYKWRTLVSMMVLFTMIFSAPLIPTYLLIKNLHMIDSLWSLMIPSAISAFNFFVLRSFFVELPASLLDSARIDGCSEWGVLFRIVVALSKPAIATLAIFYSVSNWNSYQSALYFLNDPRLYPLQVKLHEMIATESLSVDNNSMFSALALSSTEGVQMATVIVATVPILFVYPLLQRHFVKGMIIGSLKE